MAKSGISLGSQKRVFPPTTITPYEKARFSNIERNAKKFQELGLDKLAQELMEKSKVLDKAKEKVINVEVDQGNDDPEYVPNDDSDHGSDDEVVNTSQKVSASSTLKSIPKKNARIREYAPRKAKKQALCPSLAMDDFLKMQQQMDATEAHELELEVQKLEQERLRSRCQEFAIVPSANQQQIVLPENQAPEKNGRGPPNLFDIHARKWEDRVVIYCNEKGQPIGPEKARKELTRFLGTIAHDYNWAPLTYTNWKSVPDKEKILEYVNSKYILPPESEDWIMETLNASWRGYKCRLKRDHYYPYDTYEDRMKNAPKRVPEEHFKTLLKYWGSTPTKKTSLQNSNNRLQQDNLHTNGPISFAMTYDKMLREDGVAPSKRKLFEKTRSRKEGKTYSRPFDDTQMKIQVMRELEASQDDQSNDSGKDPFDEVMGDGLRSCKRLLGLGVSRKKQKEKGTGSSLILPKEVMESIKSAVTIEVQKDLNAEREQLLKEKEAHAAKVAEMEMEMERAAKEAHDAKVAEMERESAAKEANSQNETMTLEVIASALTQLRQKDPTLTSEMIAKVIVSSATNAG